MGENTHQNCTRQNKNKEDPGRQQPCWGFLFCTKLTQPTGNVDQETAGEIMDIFVQMHQLKKTVVIVTHDMDVAMKCENVIKLSDGMICES